MYMSIMQEYEAIKRQIGLIEWNNIKRFLKCNPDLLLNDVLYNKEVYQQYEQWKEGN